MEGTYPVPNKIMDANLLQKLNKAKDMSDQKGGELEGSVGLAMASI